MLQQSKRVDAAAPCAACAARLHGVCGVLSGEQLAALSKTSARREAAEGAQLLADHQTAQSYANIVSGVVKLTASLPDGRQQIVGLQFAPDFPADGLSSRSGGGSMSCQHLPGASSVARRIRKPREAITGQAIRELMRCGSDVDAGRRTCRRRSPASWC